MIAQGMIAQGMIVQGMIVQRSNNSGMGGDAGQVGSVAMQAELAVWGGWML